MTTLETLAHLRAVEQAATPAPWVLWDKRGQPTRDFRRDPLTLDTSQWTGPILPESCCGVLIGGWNRSPTYDDSVFIATARNTYSALLAVAEAAADLTRWVAERYGDGYDPIEGGIVIQAADLARLVRALKNVECERRTE